MSLQLEDLPLVLNVDEAAAALRLDRKTVYAGIHAGQLRAIRIGRAIRIPRGEIERLLCGGPGPDSPAPATINAPVPGERHDDGNAS